MNLNVKIMKLLEENVEGILCDHAQGRGTQEGKLGEGKLDLIKTK